MQNTRKLQSKLCGSFGLTASPGHIPAPPDQLKIVVKFNPKLISVIMLVRSFSTSQAPSAEEKIAFLLSFYVIYSAKEKQQ